ncbi:MULTISPECIES: M4 family metallopeptidase [unclassified Streptomyces]|uniref:M4 family metallopeptidase n=1 Tax=unclassified Streptomyces TaxID=2593676 RepID=UPI001BE9FB61|nr:MULTISPECIES: M4 family metallopeptidase [unclassified Streptomyces]MBT2405225.1 M4 family metallopeptidase [Streptomyces sp. ISL-21]MBT2610993.1 M4 family metallopeptidase [Streptomyces sp. ISL-87]
MKRKLAIGAVLSTSALLASAIQVSAGLAQAAPAPAPAGQQRAALLAQAGTDAPATGRALGLGKAEKLVVKDVVTDADGSRHVRYERTYNGLPVLGGDLIVHQDAKGAVKSADKAVKASIAPASLSPKLSASQAAAKAAGAANATVGIVEDEDEAALASVDRTGAARLVVWAASGTPRLAYETLVEGTRADGTPSSQRIVTDAASGEVLSTREGVETANAAGTGKGVFVGSVPLTTNSTGTTFELKDATRGGQYTVSLANKTGGNGTLYTDADNAWGDGTAANGQSAAVDAQYGAAATWDFYKNTFSRSGIRNDGVGAYSRVHYGRNYVNAFWSDSCFCMTYGDGASNTHPLTELDVSGHEMSHGVTANTAGLNYSGESGGLNEATSDIFGTGVEFYANLASDKGDYLIGELIDLNGNGTPLRYMDKPSKDGKSADSWSSGVGSLNVHYSSGVANHFFYLLSEGSGAKTINGVDYNSPTSNGSTVTGIGRDKALQIWYRALTVYMTSTTDYKGARAATLKAAGDLYGATSTEYQTVAAAWSGVNVN